MIVVDSNVILRYLLADDEKLFKKAKEVIEKESCLVLPEILNEVVLALETLYEVPREDISAVLIEFLNFENVMIADVYIQALFLYGHKEISFLEAVLCSYAKEQKVVSFSKRVKKCVKD